MTAAAVDAGGLTRLAMRILEAHEVPGPDARLVADSLVEAELWGHASHGVLQFLIKPLDLDTLRERLGRYVHLHARLSEERDLDQMEIDGLLAAMHPQAGRSLDLRLPKGHSPVTAELVLDALTSADEPRSAAEVAERVGISRWTAQRYLTTLADMGLVNMQPQYGTAGRPEHRYAVIAAP